MDYFIYSLMHAVSFILGFLLARILYINMFNKKSAAYGKVISSLKRKYLFQSKRNYLLEEKLNKLQPGLFTIKYISNKITLSKN